MAATEHARTVGTLGLEYIPTLTTEMTGRAERPRPCAGRDVSRSHLCQMNTEFSVQAKGRLTCLS
jgi:hypothetical protein